MNAMNGPSVSPPRTDTHELIEIVRRDWGPAGVQTRAEAEEAARKLLDRAAGNLTEEQARELAALLSKDMKFGRERRGRFSPAFAGAHLDRIAADMDIMNDWTRRLWKGSEEEALTALDDICRQQNAFPGAGRSYPSILLYLRDPDRFPIWITATERGLAALTDYTPQGRPTGSAGYNTFRSRAVSFMKENGIQPQELDIVLSLASRRPTPGGKPSGTVEDQLDLEKPLFSDRTFELLAELTKDPTVECYKRRRDDIRVNVELPVQLLMRAVAEALPQEIRDLMETSDRVFARIPKNDFGKGGAWDYYWGAFYPKGGKRIEDAQLFVWINRDRMQFGFYIGEYGSKGRASFIDNLRKHGPTVLPRLSELLEGLPILYGMDKADPEALPTAESVQEWIGAAQSEGVRTMRVLERDELTTATTGTLIEEVRSTFEALFPFVLLATSQEPVPAIEEYLGGTGAPVNPEYSLVQLAEDISLEEETVERWLRALDRKGQAVFYGPPGTGKTFTARHVARHLVGGNDGFIELVQFHPAYAYEDFMQGIRPETTDSGHLAYRTVPGRFLEFCSRARSRTGPCVLIVDEINRANLSRVFGELMYLLEYRTERVPLAGGGEFFIPSNVRLIGTMNTADRSIALVDHALRRRFAFIYLAPNMGTLRAVHKDTDFPVDNLIGLLERLNEEIGDPHYEIGISYFLHEDLASEIEDIWRMEIEPYLEEYFFDKQQTVEKYRWEKVGSEILA